MTWRILILLHRYLGVAIGALMLMWFASGIVMLYVPYPILPEQDRLAMLQPISWQACCGAPTGPLAAGQPVTRAEVESIAGTLAVRLSLPGHSGVLASIDASEPEVPLDLPQARLIAAAAAQRSGVDPPQPATQQTIVRDQWTVGGEYNADRPLMVFGFNDRAGTRIYVSSHSGRVVLRTTATQRFWNWLGAVPHWLYPTILRSHVQLWTQVVIWTAVAGVFLTTLGLYLGIVQFAARGKRLLSPYAGIWNWHHSLGLLFGILTLTWVASGLISMNPWGFLDSGPGVQPPPAARSVTWGQVQASLVGIARRPAAPNIVSLGMAPLFGELFWIATEQGGARVRLDAAGHVSPLTAGQLLGAAQHTAGSHGIASGMLLRSEDSYYYQRRGAIRLPIFRAIVNDADQTRLYLDPVSGRLLGQVDRAGRWQRWLFDGLHTLDFSARLRTSMAWSALLLLLLLGGLALSATGTYLAVRRVICNIAHR
ncbi:MAG TPA: PepSY domain-containing protein [Steroidobacteraceae bacterium]